MKKPLNQTAEVLFELIKRKSIDRRTILLETGILNLTARIANLRIKHNLVIKCEKIKVKNKHNRSISYGLWSVLDKKDARELYNKINK